MAGTPILRVFRPNMKSAAAVLLTALLLGLIGCADPTARPTPTPAAAAILASAPSLHRESTDSLIKLC